jgi:hypothetical protein
VTCSANRPLPDEANLRVLIGNAFLTEPYNGPVTPVDGSEWTEELDDAIELWQSLSGKSWTEVPDEFVDRHYGSLVLLTPTAFAAFLPAWLSRSLLNSNVREFTVYAFAPNSNRALKEHWNARMRCLLPQHVDCVRIFLSSVEEGDHAWNQNHAAIALEALADV